VLAVENLDLYYGDAQALAGVSLEAAAGTIVAVIGANGAGKSSLIRAIAGIERPRSGRILFEGQDVTSLPSHRICALGIGHVAEGRQIFPSMSVADNLDLGAVSKGARAQRIRMLHYVYDLFPRLHERRRQIAGTLSGGEQQMVAIARCLMGTPKLILFDEPSLGLAPTIVKEVFQVMRRLNDEGLTIVLVEQNVAVSLKIATRAYVLENGRIVLSGSGEELLHLESVRRAYLGM
jgi:branched-chain amino acid transport system ATP-binding protein